MNDDDGLQMYDTNGGVYFEYLVGKRKVSWNLDFNDTHVGLVETLRDILEVVDGTPSPAPPMPAFVGMLASGVGTLSEEVKPQGVPWGSGKEDDLPIVG